MMGWLRNPGRVAGLWYLATVFVGPVRLIFIPDIVDGPDASAMARALLANETLVRVGMASEVVGALVLIMLVTAFWRLFEGVDRSLSRLMLIFGGVMPALLLMLGPVFDGGALMVAGNRHDFFNALAPAQRDALAAAVFRLHDQEVTAAEMLWGVWLFPLAALIWKSRLLPRFLALWLAAGGVAYVALCLIGLIAPQGYGLAFTITQPFRLGELALTLWLLVRGAGRAQTGPPASAAGADAGGTRGL